MLAARQAGWAVLDCSLDLQRSTTTVETDAAALTWQGQRYPYLDACKERTIYRWSGDAFQPIARFTSSLIKLVPTEWGPPTFEIDGIKMLPTAAASPYEDAARKVALIRAARQGDSRHLRRTGILRGVVPAGRCGRGALFREKSGRALAARSQSLVAGAGRQVDGDVGRHRREDHDAARPVVRRDPARSAALRHRRRALFAGLLCTARAGDPGARAGCFTTPARRTGSPAAATRQRK